MDLTFISLLRVPKMRSGVFGLNSRRCVQHALSLTVAIERCCAIDANHAQNGPFGPEGVNDNSASSDYFVHV